MNNTNLTLGRRFQKGFKFLRSFTCRLNSVVRLCSVVILLLVFVTANAGLVNAQTFSFKFGKKGGGNGEFNLPTSIVVDTQGNIFVADTFNHRIQKFNSKGEHLKSFGMLGSGDGQFNLPDGLAISKSGRLHIGDSKNNRIQVFGLDLVALIIRFGSVGVDDGQFFGGFLKLATDSLNNIYVLDPHLERVQKFSPNSTFILKFGNSGLTGPFQNTADIAIDRSDNIWVADRLGDQLQKFDSNGTHLLTIGTFRIIQRPISLATDSSNNLYVGFECGSIGKFDSDGKFILKLGIGGVCPNALAVDGQDNLYIAGSTQNDYFVQVYRADTDRDGLKGSFDLDSDNDGIPDSIESLSSPLGLGAEEAAQFQDSIVLDDPDGDGIPNELDLDSDGDGIPDVIEAEGVDEDGNGLIDDFTDEDQDGLADRFEDAPLPVPDTDEDGIADFLDGDADDDGATDVSEAGGMDDDGDGMLDDSLDEDGDGLADGVQTSAGGEPLPLLDLDSDGVPDFLDSDQATEGGGGGCTLASVNHTPSIPLYLLLPIVILSRRLWRGRSNWKTPE